MTPSVHYIRFELNTAQVERFATAPVVLRVNHLHCSEATALADQTEVALLEDLRPAWRSRFRLDVAAELGP